MLLIGLTGSIATGKSTVSALLSSPSTNTPTHNLPLIDADLLARQVVLPGTRAYRQIVAHFSSTTPDLLLPPSPSHPANPAGQPLNRPALGRRVFGNDSDRVADRKVLNSIVHPAVRLAMFRALAYYYFTGSPYVVLDIPLLFESRLDVFCGTVIVVAVSDPKIQMERLRSRDPHLSEEDARNRVASQVDVRVKAERCLARNTGGKDEEGRGYVVYNDGSKEDLRRDVGEVMRKVYARSPRWWSWLLLACPPLMGAVAGWEVLRAWLARSRLERDKEVKEGGEGKEMAKPKL